MTSKQRVLAAVAHKQPDRVPVNYLANPGIDRRLKEHFGIDPADDEALRKALGVDFRMANPTYTGNKLHADYDDRRVDNWGIHRRWVQHETGGYWDYCDWPLTQATVEQIDDWAMPSPDDYDYSALARTCEKYRDYCVVLGHPGIGDIINATSMLRTMEQVLIDLITDDPAGLRLIDRRQEIVVEIIRRSLEAAEGKIDMLWIGEDLGTQIGPIISLELFRRHIRPRLQKFVDLGRRWNIPVMMHSCGSSSWAFDNLIEMGVSVIDTLQPEAKDMAPAYIKQRWGDKLAFHGCISTAGPLACGSVDEVVGNVRETLEVMMPSGGYLLAPTHEIQDNSPTENVVAMYEAAREFGRY